MTKNVVHLGALRVIRSAPHHMVTITLYTLHITHYTRYHSAWWVVHGSFSS